MALDYIMVPIMYEETGTRYGLLPHQCGKRVKLKVRMFVGLIPTFVEITGGYTGGAGGLFCLTPILNRVNCVGMEYI